MGREKSTISRAFNTVKDNVESDIDSAKFIEKDEMEIILSEDEKQLVENYQNMNW